MSMDKKTFVIRERCHLEYFLGWLAENWQRQTLAGKPIAITASETKRSHDQNAKLWVLLAAFSEQVEWQVNGKAQHLTSEDWKDLLSAAFMHETGRIAPGIDGGMVLLGSHTKDFTVRQFSEFIEFIQAAGAAREVNFDRQTEAEPLVRTA
jgi:hypothetical protein